MPRESLRARASLCVLQKKPYDMSLAPGDDDEDDDDDDDDGGGRRGMRGVGGRKKWRW